MQWGFAANKCEYTSDIGLFIFRGSDGKCTLCSKPEGDHYTISGTKFCYVTCCKCVKQHFPTWNFDGLACDACKSRQRQQMRAGGDYLVSGANAIKEEGNALHNEGKYSEAAEKYQAAKQNLHGNASASAQQVKMSCCLNLASCYLKTGQHDLVVEECSNVIQMDTKNLKALYRRGQAYAAMGRHSMAERS